MFEKEARELMTTLCAGGLTVPQEIAIVQAALQSASASGGWVSVKERPAPKGVWLWVISMGQVQYCAAKLDDDGCLWEFAPEGTHDLCPVEEVTYWQPLPEPPAEQGRHATMSEALDSFQQESSFRAGAECMRERAIRKYCATRASGAKPIRNLSGVWHHFDGGRRVGKCPASALYALPLEPEEKP